MHVPLSIGSAPPAARVKRPEAAAPVGGAFARALPFELSVIAGATDIIGFLGLGGLFTAHVSGNLVVLAARMIAGSPTTLSHVLAVPVFMLVLLLTCLVARAIAWTGRSTVRPLLLLQLLLLAGFFGLSVAPAATEGVDATRMIVAGMVGVSAMAVQNALVQVGLKNTPSTAVMTTILTRLMQDVSILLVGRDATEIAKAKTRARQTVPVVIGFALGCGAGAAAEAAVGLWSLLLPTALALCAVATGTGAAATAEVQR